MKAADDAVVLTSEEPTILADTFALMKAILKDQPSLHLGTVINSVESRQSGQRINDELSRVYHRPFNVEPHCLGVLRCDWPVAAVISRQTSPLQCYPNYYAAQDLSAIAEALISRAPMP